MSLDLEDLSTLMDVDLMGAPAFPAQNSQGVGKCPGNDLVLNFAAPVCSTARHHAEVR